MIETFIITLIIAKIKKYELKNIFKDWSMYLIFIQLLAYIYLTYTIFVNNFTFIKYQRQIQIIFIVSYFIVAIKNKLYNFSVFDNVNNKFIKYITSPYIISTIFLLIGSGLNNIAIKINNGFMPVYLYTSKLTSFGLNAVLKSMTRITSYNVCYTKLLRTPITMSAKLPRQM